MFNKLIDFFIIKKLKKEIFELQKEKQKTKEELKEVSKKLSKFRQKYINEHEKFGKLKAEFEKLVDIEFEIGEMYVVNVCATYFVSNKKILLTGSQKKLLDETKKLKYRPIIITNISLPEIKVISLSTDFKYNPTLERVEFNTKNCKFITKKCFIGKIEEKSYIFEYTIKRKEKRITKRQIPFPISIFKFLEEINKLPNKKRNTLFSECNLNENYKLIKKCATCDKEYLKNIINQLGE